MIQEKTHPPRWLRWAQILWLSVITITLILYAVGTVIYFQQLREVCTLTREQCAEYDYATPVGAAQLAAHGLSLDTYALLLVGIRFLYALVPITIGLLIFARRREEPIALLVSFFLITFGIAGGGLAVLGETYPALQWFTTLMAFASAVSLPLFFGLFPNGRMVPRAYWLVVSYFFIFTITTSTVEKDPVNDPFWSAVSYIGWLSTMLGGVAAQVYRYVRVSTPKEKRQTRWVLYGMAVMALLLVSALVYTGISGDNTIGTPEDPNLPRRVAFLLVLNLMFQVIYLSIGMAILRSSLFDIDVIIRKTLLYASLTALLGLVYFGVIVILQELFGRVSGQANSPLAIVISTLAIAALFNPLRLRLQNFIDRRFFRQKYNAEHALEAFARSARDEVEIERLTSGLMNTVQKTIQPLTVMLWIKK